MLHLRSRVIAHLISCPATSPASPLRRLISAVSPSPAFGFSVEEYLVTACGLTGPQAVKASAKLSHLKSPSNPDAVLAFLAGLGLSGADVAAVVAKDPQLLCAGVEKTLAPNVAGLTGLGLSRSEIVRMVLLSPDRFRCKSIISKLHYYLPLFGSSENLLRALKRNLYLLSSDLDGVVKPNVKLLRECGLGACDIARLCIARPSLLSISTERSKNIIPKLHYYMPLFGSSENLLRAFKRNPYLFSSDLEGIVKPNVAYLQECGLGACDIAKLCISTPRLLTTNPKRVQAIVTSAQNIGVPRGSRMFRHALRAVASFREEEIAARVDYLRNTFRWTDAEVGRAVSRAPMVLTRAKESLQHTSELLISEVGLEPAYIAHRPTLLTFSLKGRLRARHYVVKFLKENGLLGRNRDYYSAVKITEKKFVEKFICPHKEAAPHLAKDYAAACKDEVPTRFRFT